MFSEQKIFFKIVSVITRPCRFILVVNVSDKFTASVFRVRAEVA